MLRRISFWLLLLLLASTATFFIILPPVFDQYKNAVSGIGLLEIEAETEILHEKLFVADLHADSLLWGRDLSGKTDRGALDIPRMQAGNHALQVFSVVTKIPRGLNIHRNKGDSDNITLLALAQRWPWSTINSLSQRALYLAERLHKFSSASGGSFTVITNVDELDRFISLRKTDPGHTAGLLALEGAQALDGKIENLHLFARAGYRMMSPAHFFNTEVGGSAHGWVATGLTEFGRQWVREMNQACLIIDLSHASAMVIDDVLKLTSKPVVVSHSGVRGTCDNSRNLSDQQLKQIADNGGLIGIGFWSVASCGDSVVDITKSIQHAVRIAGIEHVALGSDFDGAVTVPFDASQMIQLTQALRNAKFSNDQIEAIMGGNIRRFLRHSLAAPACYTESRTSLF